MNNSSFLDYYKTILEKVSFDQKLLAKEYRKAKQLLENSEAKDLDYWLQRKGFARKLDTVTLDQNESRISNFY